MSAPDAEAAAATLAARHGLSGAPSRFSAGSVPVYAVGEAHVLKLFPLREEAHWLTEQVALQAVQGRLPVPTPALHAADVHGEWRYLLMERLMGQPLDELWPQASPEVRADLMDQVGRMLAALHALPVSGLAAITPDWPTFISRRREGCWDRQVQYGLTSPWAEQLEPFLGEVALPPAPAPALLHTEVMHAHLLVVPDGDGLRLTGLVDFEPAMVGDPDYELASVAVFVSVGDPALFERVLTALRGPMDAPTGRALRRRVMAWMLLHRYSRLAWYLERLPPPPDVRTLDALAARWLG